MFRVAHRIAADGGRPMTLYVPSEAVVLAVTKSPPESKTSTVTPASPAPPVAAVTVPEIPPAAVRAASIAEAMVAGETGTGVVPGGGTKLPLQATLW